MAHDLANRFNGQMQAQQQAQAPTIQSQIQAMEKQFQMAMPRGLEAAQLVRDALTVVRQTPKLAECEPNSLIGSLMTAAQLGLRPGVGALGHCYILPFYNGRTRRMEAQFILGYQGMLELANRSGDIEYVTAQKVCANDEFRQDPISGKHQHLPPVTGSRGEVMGYYCVFFRKGSERGQMVYMTKEDMEDHRDKFATAKKNGQVFGPWKDHFDAMALKTVVRQNFKFMPKSTMIENALVADETIRLTAAPMDDLSQVSERPSQQDWQNQPAEVTADPVTGEVMNAPADKAQSMDEVFASQEG